VHGTTAGGIQRCVSLNSAATTIRDSRLTDCHGRGYDTQAIGGWNGPGPFRIENNLLEGAGENVMLGGADPAIPGLVPADIVIPRNLIRSRRPWRGRWTVKNPARAQECASGTDRGQRVQTGGLSQLGRRRVDGQHRCRTPAGGAQHRVQRGIPAAGLRRAASTCSPAPTRAPTRATIGFRARCAVWLVGGDSGWGRVLGPGLTKRADDALGVLGGALVVGVEVGQACPDEPRRGQQGGHQLYELAPAEPVR